MSATVRRMKWLAWLGCACVALSVAGACGGGDGKQSQRREDGGAGGEIASAGAAFDPAHGGQPALPEGGAGGIPATGQAGELTGVGGELTGIGGEPAGVGGEAGAGGVANAELSLASLEGNWYGHLLSSYVCESNVQNIALNIEGGAVTSTWPPSGNQTTGLIQQAGAQDFTFELLVDYPEDGESPSSDQHYRGQLYVHPSAQYAIFVALAYTPEGVAGWLDIAILQKGQAPGEPTGPGGADLAGDWQGNGLELNEELGVVQEFPSRGSFIWGDGVLMDGTDRDGGFSGSLTDQQQGQWLSSYVPQGDTSFGLITLMSDDKRVLALAFLRRQGEDSSALCDTGLTSDMSLHKFGLWTKATE